MRDPKGVNAASIVLWSIGEATRNKPYPTTAKRGRRANRERDLAIAFAVQYLVDEHGYRPTRNRSAHGSEALSACGVVREALLQDGILLDETTVEKIWEKQRKKLPELLPGHSI